jgi:hypothetical protein
MYELNSRRRLRLIFVGKDELGLTLPAIED